MYNFYTFILSLYIRVMYICTTIQHKGKQIKIMTTTTTILSQKEQLSRMFKQMAPTSRVNEIEVISPKSVSPIQLSETINLDPSGEDYDTRMEFLEEGKYVIEIELKIERQYHETYSQTYESPAEGYFDQPSLCYLKIESVYKDEEEVVLSSDERYDLEKQIKGLLRYDGEKVK